MKSMRNKTLIRSHNSGVWLQGRSLRDMEEVRSSLKAFPSPPGLWKPSDGQSREDWLQCHGQPADVCRRTREKLSALKKLIAAQTPHHKDEDQLVKPAGVVSTNESVIIDNVIDSHVEWSNWIADRLFGDNNLTTPIILRWFNRILKTIKSIHFYMWCI